MAQRQTRAQTKTAKTKLNQRSKASATRIATPRSAPKKPVAARKVDKTPETTVAKPNGKLGELLSLIEAREGATLDELSAALSWQPHSTRAAITGLRKRGFEIALTTQEDRRAYRTLA